MTRFALPFVLFALAGCDSIDPYLREGVWRPSGANEANLRAMAATSRDLVKASRPSPGDGGLAAAAVDRLAHDRVRALPDSGIAQVVPIAGGSKSQTPASPAAGGTN